MSEQTTNSVSTLEPPPEGGDVLLNFTRTPREITVVPLKSKTTVRHVSVLSFAGMLIVYAAIALFIYPDWINIGAVHGADELAEVRILGMPTPDIAFVLILGFSFMTNMRFRRAVLSGPCRTLILFLGFYSFVGMVFGNGIGWVREDWRIWLWGFAGFAAFQLIMKCRKPCFHILTICLIMGYVLFLSAKGAQSAMDNHAFLENDRVWDLNVFNYAGTMTILLGLVLTLCALKNIAYLAGAVLAVGLYFYSAVIASATRSLSFAFLLVCGLAVLTLMYRRNRNVIMRRIGGKGLLVAILVFAAAALVVATFLGLAFTSSTILADRWQSGDMDSGWDRFVELGDALRQLGPIRGFTGGGLGYTFESIFDYTSLILHIGIFVFLLKFGIFPFIAIAIFLYVVLPFKFLQAIWFPRTLTPYKRTALLVTLPGILGWVLILAMSGGYDHYYFIAVGLSLGVYTEIRARGLKEICR